MHVASLRNLLVCISCSLLLAACESDGDSSVVDESDRFDFTEIPGSREWNVHDRMVDVTREGDREVLTLDEQANEGLVWLDDALGAGTINIELRGNDRPQQSFVGVAFGIQDDESYEAIYFRPFNFVATEPDPISHQVQYISMPDYNWDRLREESPGVYESEMTMPLPDPNDWFRATIEIEGATVSVRVDGATEPSLTVTRIGGRPSGGLGVFVGDGAGGDFANLRFDPAE